MKFLPQNKIIDQTEAGKIRSNATKDVIYYHHERWDGNGYPLKLKGEEIPIAARIFTIIDHWDALTSDRPYRKAWPEEKVREHFMNQRGKIFDPDLTDLFFEKISVDKIS